MADQSHLWRIGIDLGGTKIAAVVLDEDGTSQGHRRVATPRDDYAATIEAIAGLVGELERDIDGQATLGIGMPGSISPGTNRVQNANSTWLNGRPLHSDLEQRLQRLVRLANDANCFALSEAIDGAGQGARSVFGVILGTGCGGGLVYRGRLIDGPRNIGGEWGHNPLPWQAHDEHPGPQCWCGQKGCMECWVSGPGLAADHTRVTGESLSPEEIVQRAGENNNHCQDTLARHASRLARGLATVVNLFDPEVIVLGGGLSEMPHLYDTLPEFMAPYIFSDTTNVTIRPPVHGASSGVRGAAWLWNDCTHGADE